MISEIKQAFEVEASRTDDETTDGTSTAVSPLVKLVNADTSIWAVERTTTCSIKLPPGKEACRKELIGTYGPFVVRSTSVEII